ncbi:MAG: inorganic phosphate transporter, partial [Anaerolineales bacterium]|nr:inorganic phosphate transporter [Anaerolineales bacterium]
MNNLSLSLSPRDKRRRSVGGWVGAIISLIYLGLLGFSISVVVRQEYFFWTDTLMIVLTGFAALIFFDREPISFVVITAAVFGAYMAINIGANDVANNMGPAVGANALSMGGAILIAAIFETAGALLAGGDVVSTIAKGIIDPAGFSDTRIFIWAMMAALISAALWVNLATFVGAPVSTTHSVVGGWMGAGIAAAG